MLSGRARAVQATYQLAVMAALLLGGRDALGLSPEEHLTFVFNTFVVLQLFNQVACRKVYDESDIFEGLGESRLFLGVLGAEALLQVRCPVSHMIALNM